MSHALSLIQITKDIHHNLLTTLLFLWPATSGVQDVEGSSGTVVGWVRDDSDSVSTFPKKVDLPIVNAFTCVQTSEFLIKTVSNRTFCAGTLNGDGPCEGDSGWYFYSIRLYF